MSERPVIESSDQNREEDNPHSDTNVKGQKRIISAKKINEFGSKSLSNLLLYQVGLYHLLYNHDKQGQFNKLVNCSLFP